MGVDTLNQAGRGYAECPVGKAGLGCVGQNASFSFLKSTISLSNCCSSSRILARISCTSNIFSIMAPLLIWIIDICKNCAGNSKIFEEL